MATDAWDPHQYDRFREERQQPFYDLLKLVVPRRAMRVVDLGCGTGELTREMHRLLKAQSTLGIDSSSAMLAGGIEVNDAGLTFRQQQIEDLTGRTDQAGGGGAFDLIFSNAALHWVSDHGPVLQKLWRTLAPGGQLAIQMPANHDHVTHQLIDAVAAEEPFAAALAGRPARAQHVRAPEDYARILYLLGAKQQHVRLQVYGHRLADRTAVVEWVKGTTLTPLRRDLGEDLYLGFVERYSARLLPLLADERPYFFPFKRLLLWAEKA